jgi:hypothetical protein
MTLRIPSESLIESALSDIEAHSGWDGSKMSADDHLDQCEVCQLMKEMGKRSEEAGEDKICELDNFIWNITSCNPLLAMMAHAKAPVVNTMMEVGRLCFLLGIKTARSQDELKKMEETFGIQE